MGAGRTEEIRVDGASTVGVERARLRRIAGNATVIDAKDVKRGRAQNLEDTLAFQPGIYAQATSGSTGNKISIRGSGANEFYGGNSLGMKYLVDGLTISGVAGLHEDRLNTTGYQSTEVLYGANGFGYASTALGGAINFIMNTGLTAPGFIAHWEGGSFGTSIEQFSDGGTFDHRRGDYYVTVARTDRQGFQVDTRTWRNDVDWNFGYRFTDRLTARLIGRWDQGEVHYGGLLTRAELRKDPSQNSDDWGIRRAKSTKMVGIKTAYDIDDRSHAEYGVSWNNYPLLVGVGTVEPSLWRYTDINQSLRYLRDDTIFGRRSNTTLVLSDVDLVNGDARYYTTNTPVTVDNKDDWTFQQRSKYGGSRDTVLALSNDSNILDRTWLTTGLSTIWIYRDVRIVDDVMPAPGIQRRESYSAVFLAPRIGLRYEINPNVDLFTNFSRSIDPPVVWQYENMNGGSSYNGTASLGRLEAQRAYTVEVGIKGSVGRFQGSLTLYRSWLHDELLSVVTQAATTTTAEIDVTSNASPTIHQGIEAGLVTKLIELRKFGSVNFRQAMTVNDFYYANDAALGHNQLPSLPRWVYQGELLYQHPSGFYANLNLRGTSSYYVDFANTLKAPSYGIWGLKVGYEPPHGHWSTFLDFRNLTDKHYATAAYTAYNLKGADSAIFYPGDGFGVFAGVTVHL